MNAHTTAHPILRRPQNILPQTYPPSTSTSQARGLRAGLSIPDQTSVSHIQTQQLPKAPKLSRLVKSRKYTNLQKTPVAPKLQLPDAGRMIDGNLPPLLTHAESPERVKSWDDVYHGWKEKVAVGFSESQIGKIVADTLYRHNIVEAPRMPASAVMSVPEDHKHSRDSYVSMFNTFSDHVRNEVATGDRPVYGIIPSASGTALCIDLTPSKNSQPNHNLQRKFDEQIITSAHFTIEPDEFPTWAAHSHNVRSHKQSQNRSDMSLSSSMKMPAQVFNFNKKLPDIPTDADVITDQSDLGDQALYCNLIGQPIKVATYQGRLQDKIEISRLAQTYPPVNKLCDGEILKDTYRDIDRAKFSDSETNSGTQTAKDPMKHVLPRAPIPTSMIVINKLNPDRTFNRLEAVGITSTRGPCYIAADHNDEGSTHHHHHLVDSTARRVLDPHMIRTCPHHVPGRQADPYVSPSFRNAASTQSPHNGNRRTASCLPRPVLERRHLVASRTPVTLAGANVSRNTMNPSRDEQLTPREQDPGKSERMNRTAADRVHSIEREEINDLWAARSADETSPSNSHRLLFRANAKQIARLVDIRANAASKVSTHESVRKKPLDPSISSYIPKAMRLPQSKPTGERYMLFSRQQKTEPVSNFDTDNISGKNSKYYARQQLSVHADECAGPTSPRDLSELHLWIPHR